MTVQAKASDALPSTKSPRCPLNMRLGGPQCRSGRFEEEKFSWGCWKWLPNRPASSPVTIPNTLFRFLYFLRRFAPNICARSRRVKAFQYSTLILLATLMFICCWYKHSVADLSTLPTQNLTWYFFVSINILYAEKKFQIKRVATSCTMQWTSEWRAVL